MDPERQCFRSESGRIRTFSMIQIRKKSLRIRIRAAPDPIWIWSKITLKNWKNLTILNKNAQFKQCCGTVTIFYGSGSGSGSNFWKVMVPVPTFKNVMVPVPVPTFEKLRFRFQFRFQLHIYTIKSKFSKKFVSFLHSKLFYKEKNYKYQQTYCKMWKKIF